VKELFLGLSLVEAPAVDFRSLALKVREAGLLERRPGYYALKIAGTTGAFAAGWAALFLVGNSWRVLAVAVWLGAVSTQLGFLGHDAGHEQVFGSRRGNRVLGMVVGNALTGASYGWWVPKHSAHHAHPNEVGRDPDVGEGLVSAPASRFGRFLARWQAELFLPLMVLRAPGIHLAGIQRMVRHRDREAAGEAVLIVAHAALYLTAVFWVLSPVKALVFILLEQGIYSVYLGCSFAPNHKGMPIVSSGARMSFAERQVSTARNVTGGRLTTFLLGGLNYQIEHHLFPVMPRPNLARAQAIVREFCVESGLGYREETMVRSWRGILSHLRATAWHAEEGPSALAPPGAPDGHLSM
jgi:fatty acid desaturase